MAITQVPLIKAVPLDFKPNCACAGRGIQPKIARFGECVLCVRDECLTGWIMHVAKRMGAASFRVDFIRKRSPAEWTEYLSYFLVHAWERIVLYGQNGLGHFDVANSARAFMRNRNNSDKYIPNQLVTQPVDLVQDWDDQVEDETVSDTIKGMVDYRDPYYDFRIHELCESIQDPVVVMEVAEQITLADAALLSGTNIATYTKYRDTVVSEVRQNAASTKQTA